MEKTHSKRTKNNGSEQLAQEILNTVYFFSLLGPVLPDGSISGTFVRIGDVYALLRHVTCSEAQLRMVVNKLVLDKKLELHGPLLSMPGEGERGTLTHLERKPYIDALWKRVRKQAFWWQFVPFVEAVFVGNSLAMGTAHENSDIDLLVITKKNRLFLGRALFSMWVHLTGLRRHDNKIRGQFCLSFWLPEDNLNLQQMALKEDPYLECWAATVKPVYGQDSYTRFIQGNKQLLDVFPNRPKDYRKPLLTESIIALSWRNFWERFLEIILIAPGLEKILKAYQMKRALKKYDVLKEPYGVIISDKILKFHDKDARKDIAGKLKAFENNSS